MHVRSIALSLAVLAHACASAASPEIGIDGGDDLDAQPAVVVAPVVALVAEPPTASPIAVEPTLEPAAAEQSELELPAMSRDGRRILTFEESDYEAHYVVLDARTGRVLRRVRFPEHFATDELGNEQRVTHRAAVRRILRSFALRFEPLAALPLARTTEDGARTYENDRVRVVARTDIDGEDGPRTSVTISDPATGAILASRTEDADDLTWVSVSADGRLVVLSETFCACECSSWSTVVQLPQS